MRTRIRLALAPALAALSLAACHMLPQKPPPDPWTHVAGDVQDPRLAALCADAWQWKLGFDPIQATYLGDPRFYGKLVLPTLSERTLRREVVAELLARADAIHGDLERPADRLTCRILREAWDQDLAELDLSIDYDSWSLDPLDGKQNLFLTLAADQPVADLWDRAACLERWGLMAEWFDTAAQNLRRGLSQGRVASHTTTAKVLEQLEAWLRTPPSESPLVALPLAKVKALGGDPAFERDIDRVARERVWPALARYRDVVRHEVLPRARSDDQPGVLYVPDGREAYLVAVQRHTTLELSPEEIHAIGLAEVERVRAEIARLGQEVFGTSDVAEIQARLRGDPALHFADAQEIEATARQALARAEAAMPAVFGRLPRASCIVVPVPAHEAPATTIAYYREPAPDGSRPGRYFINTYQPATRPRYDAEALAFHEAVPGHHLQTAIAQELDGVPLVQRYLSTTAYVEGWALYTERLADELGLYSGGIDRLGMLSFDAWRGCRLVVDTGIHALGWSRQQAIEYMAANTLLAENNVVNEVDRYIAWPGQALAYKLGQIEIQELRRRAEEELGARFDLAAFHDRVLENGPLALSLLREHIQGWVADWGAAQAAAAESGPPARGD